MRWNSSGNHRARLNTTYIRHVMSTMPGRELETGYRCLFSLLRGQLSKSSQLSGTSCLKDTGRQHTPRRCSGDQSRTAKFQERSSVTGLHSLAAGAAPLTAEGRGLAGGGAPENPACGLAGPLTHSHRSSALTLGLSFPIRAPQAGLNQ